MRIVAIELQVSVGYLFDEGTGAASKSEVSDNISILSFIMPSSVTESLDFNCPRRNDPPLSSTLRKVAYLFSITCSYIGSQAPSVLSNLQIEIIIAF